MAKKESRATVIVIDAGGRGAVLVDAYAKSKHVARIIAIPGNDGMYLNAQSKSITTYTHLKTTSIKEILDIAKQAAKKGQVLVDVAQDNAVEQGLVDELEKLGIPIIGPTRAAGQIEWDKAWARTFGKKLGLPQPQVKICNSTAEGISFIKSQNKDSAWYIKASGLAEGKGAIPAQNNKEAIAAIQEMARFGKAGEVFVIEEYLAGEEFSAFAVTDGKRITMLGYAQDHKTVNDHDLGPNTGGMGCVSPPLLITPKLQKQIQVIFQKTIQGLYKAGRPYKGILYLGGIVCKTRQGDKPYIIEFNARWGDPEAEVIIPGLKIDFFELGIAVSRGDIRHLKIRTDGLTRVNVAGASLGYPDDYSSVKGKKIWGFDKVLKQKDIKLYTAGVKKQGKEFVASGGRLFYVVGVGKNILEARQKAYGAMALVQVEDNNLHYRTDIGYRDVKRRYNKA